MVTGAVSTNARNRLEKRGSGLKKAGANPTVGELWTKYEQQIANFRSAGLLQDLVNDMNGPTLHRWQILIWTAVLAAIYVGAVDASLETPSFGRISGGVYLGFKANAVGLLGVLLLSR